MPLGALSSHLSLLEAAGESLLMPPSAWCFWRDSRLPYSRKQVAECRLSSESGWQCKRMGWRVRMCLSLCCTCACGSYLVGDWAFISLDGCVWACVRRRERLCVWVGWIQWVAMVCKVVQKQTGGWIKKYLHPDSIVVLATRKCLLKLQLTIPSWIIQCFYALYFFDTLKYYYK